MSTFLRFFGSLLLVGIVGILATPSAPAAPTDPELTNLDKARLREQGIEVAPKGPIHEAFARPADLNPQPTPPVPKQPPPNIPEVPPDVKPQGDNVQWIPGYWAWDAEKKDYLWVSGFYRNMPQGRKYVPGYWTQNDQGWQWVPGFFAPEGQADLQYLPQPPATLENGPSVPAPDDASFYTPGTWYYDGTQFVWRPGYWSPYQTGRIWVNSSYTWTPAGWVFVPGYWDYALADRGMLYAPVYFNGPYWNQPGWSYCPSVALGLGGLLNGGLFYRNGYPGYYYGPYFGGYYAGLGFMPWFGGPFWGNPFYGYYRWYNRGNPGWWNGMRNFYARGGIGAPLQFASVNNIRNTFNGRPVLNLNRSQLAAQRVGVNQFRQLALNRSTLERTAFNQGGGVRTMRLTAAKMANPAVVNGAARGNVSTVHTPTFNGANLRTPTYRSGLPGNYSGRQGLTGHPPAASSSAYRTPAYNMPSYNYRSANSYGTAHNYQPKTGITGTPRYSTRMYYPPTHNLGGFSGRSGTGSYLYHPGTTGGGYYRPSSTYHPSTIYHPAMPSYRGGSFGGGHYGGGHYGGFGGGHYGGFGGGHMGGGHMGGGHGGGGHGHR